MCAGAFHGHACQGEKLMGVILPKSSAQEASMVEGLEVYGIDSLAEAVDFLNGENSIEPIMSSLKTGCDRGVFNQ